MESIRNARELAELAAALADNEGATTADFYRFAALATQFAQSNAYGEPDVLTTVAPGDEVKVRPFVQVAVSRGHATPVQLPVSVPATVMKVSDDAGRPEYVMVEFDSALYGHRPWWSERAVHILSRGELHSPKCRCHPCSGHA